VNRVAGVRRRRIGGEPFVAVLLCVMAAGTVYATARYPEYVNFPFTMLLAPLLLGVLLLSNRVMAWFVGYELVMVAATAAVMPSYSLRQAVTLGVVLALCLLVLWFSTRGRPIGVTGRHGASMLVDLRDRILAQGEIPALPSGWLVESALYSAGGSPFAGDFVVATTRERDRRLEVALVDVSGKGEAAGTRALQLSGAMGGLLGALPADGFLPAANDYLLQRAWEEGFATAVHLSVDLVTGDYELRGAGHPPPVQRHAGSGRWQVLPTDGPVLGLIDGVGYAAVRGRLLRGDALLLYTDGMVEEPRKDIDLGIDGMLGAAESLLRRSWDGMAERLATTVGSPDDDRALLVVHRR
jgi:hypothetical protein